MKQENNNGKMSTGLTLMGIIVCGGVFGWVYETLFYMYNYDGLIVKRGSCFGPWIDIYCLGGILMYFLCRKHTGKPWLVFVLSGAVCGALEYAAGFILDRVNGGNWGWDYSHEKLNFGNLNGYICLRSVLTFALSGFLLFYLILPALRWLREKIGQKAFSVLFILLGTIILLDIAYNDIAAYMFGMPSAASIYRDLGWFSPVP